jgi:IAA-amino acid hydrolase
MFRLGVAREGVPVTPLHTPRFDVDESALAIGARILAGAVVHACQPLHGAGA